MYCAKAVKVPVPLVAAHNDLTMWNVLMDKQGQLGVVDWEAGREHSFVLIDFFYAMTDAVAIAHRYANRQEAVEACFAPSGMYTSVVARLQQRLQRTLEVSPCVADLSFHACWLHHAANEHLSSQPGSLHPFLETVQWLALHRAETIGWMKG